MTKTVWEKSNNPEVRAFASKIESKVRAKAEDGKIKCAEAFALAKAEQVSVKRVGEALNELEVKVSGGQLGCFK